MSGVVSCQKCGTKMVFARTEKGKAMPLNAARVTNPPESLRGHFVIERAEDGSLACRQATEGDRGNPDSHIHLSHFGDCPAAKEFSRKARR